MERFAKGVSLLILPLIIEIVYSATKAFFLNDVPIWSFEITLFLYGITAMLGAAYTHREKKHVAVEVLLPHVSPKSQRTLKIISEAVVLFVVLVMLYVSVPNAWKSTIMFERSTHQTPFNPPVWWYRWLIPVSCTLIAYQALRDLVGLAIGRGTDKERKETKHNAA